MAKPKSKLERKSLIPPSIMALITALLFIMSAVSIVSAQRIEMSRTETAQAQKTVDVSSEQKEAPTEPQKRSDEKPVEKPKEESPAPPKEEPKVDPNGCEAKGMWWRADNYECIPKPAAAATNKTAPASSGSGSCQAEIAKYGWNQSVATAVMLAESGGNTGIVNNNPATGDYSVGCFQVNIYGANARTRPSEAALKNAATNVQWAYNNYVANGHSFLGQWGVCRSKVACY
jgi:cytoskeletal protein RodZ